MKKPVKTLKVELTEAEAILIRHTLYLHREVLRTLERLALRETSPAARRDCQRYSTVVGRSLLIEEKLSQKPKDGTSLPPMLDLASPEQIDIHYSHDTRKLWMNVNGQCVVRAQNIQALAVVDDDPKAKTRSSKE